MFPNYLKRELLVLFFIINKKQTSVKEISEYLNLSKRTVKETILTINDHFMEHLTKKKFFISENTGIIKINPKMSKDAVDYAYRLKLSLLKKNMLFNYCVLLTTRNNLKKEDILNQLFISTSYFNKLTQRLNKFFHLFDFTITNVDNIYCIRGNEFNIRLFSYLFLQDSFHNIDWPFPNVSIASIREKIPKRILRGSHKRANTEKLSLYILLAVLQIRIDNNNYIAQPHTTDIQTMFSIVQKEYSGDIIFHNNILDTLSENTQINEIQYINFLSHIFISDIISKKEKIGLGETFFTQDHPYCVLSKEVLLASYNLKKNVVSEEHTYLCMYYITLFNTFYFLVGDTIDHFTNLFIPKLTYNLNLKNNYIESITECIKPFINTKNHLNLVSSILYTLSISGTRSPVRIYLQMTKDFTASYFIEQRLLNLYNPDNIFITHNYFIADIVVTDTLEGAALGKNIFYLENINNKESWKELLDLIQQVYLEKQQIQDNDVVVLN